MPRKSKNRSSHLGMLPLTSMIDVVFLLLVYFLVTSNFAEPERELPSTVATEGGSSTASDLQPQIVDIKQDADGVLFTIGGRGVRSQYELTDLLRILPKEPGVAIRSDQHVSVIYIAQAMQAAQDSGFEKRSYVPHED